MRLIKPSILIAVVTLSCASGAHAQESINVPAPTQPAVGVLAFRQQLLFTQFAASVNRDSFHDWQSRSMFTYGIAGSLAAELQLPIDYRQSDDSTIDEVSVGMIRLGLKQRIWQSDPGATDTARISLLYGLIIPAGPAEMTGVGIRPQIGATAMKVHGRHGITGAARYTFSFAGPTDHLMPGSGDASLLELDAAYLFRIFPDEFTESCPDGWYLVGELSHNYETNGDHELRLTPGILFEGTHFAAELGVQLPVYHDLQHRPKRDITVVAGLRFLF